MHAVFGDRLERLRAALVASELDALLVSALPNVRYLTGFTGSNGLVIVTASEAILLTDFRYAAQAKLEVTRDVRVVIEPNSLWVRLWSELRQLPQLEIVAFESAHTTHQDSARFVVPGSEGAAWRWRPALNLVEILRESKDDAELAHINTAVEIAQHALTKTLPKVRVGMSESEVAATLEWEMRLAGSEKPAFETIVAAGARSALPHARATQHVIEAGDLLLIDFGATSGGYVSDITRTFVVGKAPTERQTEIYAVVREANASASAAVRAGMRGRDADALARDYIERRGYGAAFGHSTGHGIGLEIHEAPRLAKTAEAPLPSGSVVTIEPGIYVEGWGGVRIEDDVLLSSDGPEVLTSFDRALMQL